MTVRAEVATHDPLSRRLRLHIIHVQGGEYERARSFPTQDLLSVDPLQVEPDEYAPLELTIDEAEAVYETLREYLGRPTRVQEDFWMRRFEEERAQNLALLQAMGARR